MLINDQPFSTDWDFFYYYNTIMIHSCILKKSPPHKKKNLSLQFPILNERSCLLEKFEKIMRNNTV